MSFEFVASGESFFAISALEALGGVKSSDVFANQGILGEFLERNNGNTS